MVPFWDLAPSLPPCPAPVWAACGPQDRRNHCHIRRYSNQPLSIGRPSGAWNVVSRGGGYNTLLPGATWQFAQFNNFVFATQQNDILQHYDITASSVFANAADGNTPQAAYITVVNSFLVLSGIASPNVYRIQWSGLNDVSSAQSFTSGINSSDFQDMADGGIVHGVSGGEYGVIFQDTAIRRLLYAPGSPFVFQIDRIAVDDGLLSPYTLVRAGNNIFWLGPQGFKYAPRAVFQPQSVRSALTAPLWRTATLPTRNFL